jgi:hypothetical protein
VGAVASTSLGGGIPIALVVVIPVVICWLVRVIGVAMGLDWALSFHPRLFRAGPSGAIARVVLSDNAVVRITIAVVLCCLVVIVGVSFFSAFSTLILTALYHVFMMVRVVTSVCPVISASTLASLSSLPIFASFAGSAPPASSASLAMVNHDRRRLVVPRFRGLPAVIAFLGSVAPSAPRGGLWLTGTAIPGIVTSAGAFAIFTALRTAFSMP